MSNALPMPPLTPQRLRANHLCAELLAIRGKTYGEPIAFMACSDAEVDYIIECTEKHIHEGVSERLEYLRTELRNETMSYGELAELQSLAKYIPEDDIELREAAGIPEENTE